MTIPIEVRRQFQIKSRDQIVFDVEGDQVRLLLEAPWSLERAFGSAPPLRGSASAEDVERLANEEVVRRYLDKMTAQ